MYMNHGTTLDINRIRHFQVACASRTLRLDYSLRMCTVIIINRLSPIALLYRRKAREFSAYYFN